jgi:hypothetical protein
LVRHQEGTRAPAPADEQVRRAITRIALDGGCRCAPRTDYEDKRVSYLQKRKSVGGAGHGVERLGKPRGRVGVVNAAEVAGASGQGTGRTVCRRWPPPTCDAPLIDSECWFFGAQRRGLTALVPEKTLIEAEQALRSKAEPAASKSNQPSHASSRGLTRTPANR